MVFYPTWVAVGLLSGGGWGDRPGLQERGIA